MRLIITPVHAESRRGQRALRRRWHRWRCELGELGKCGIHLWASALFLDAPAAKFFSWNHRGRGVTKKLPTSVGIPGGHAGMHFVLCKFDPCSFAIALTPAGSLRLRCANSSLAAMRLFWLCPAAECRWDLH